ncbi:MAG: FAD-dependent oxidoreductase [Fimbriimonadaceae bacterium]
MRVAVLGAGIMGASCARWLAEAGHQTTVFDQFAPGHSFGSSHGGQKIVRQAYPDPFHTGILLKAHALWRELEDACGLPIYHEVGLAYISQEAHAGAMAKMLSTTGVLNQTVYVLPEPMVLSNGEAAVLTPGAGWVSTQNALDGTLALARAAGAELIHHKVGNLEELRDFDHRVITAGPWAGTFLNLRLRPTLQTSAYFQGHYEGPVWIEGFGHEVYGFPNEPGSDCFKVGFHTAGPDADLGSADRLVQEAQVAALIDVARRRFQMDQPTVRSTFSCIYTRTLDERFRIGLLEPGTIVVSACSGHGYKFAPWVGRLVSRMAIGKEQPPPEFDLTDADRIS